MKEVSPPKLALRFLRWFCPPALYEGIEGDLLENFELDCEIHGQAKAKRLFMLNAIRFFRPGIILRNQFNHHLINTIMLGNYVKVASRNMAKRKLYSFINAFGLSIAIAFCTLIYLYVQDEKSFDQFHSNKNNIYQLLCSNFDQQKFDEGERIHPYKSNPYMPARLGEVMLEELAEVKHMTRFNNYNEGIIRYEDKKFKQRYASVDSGFFAMFSFKILAGNPRNPLRSSSDVVLTPDIAGKLFGDDDPIGKTFTLERNGQQISLTVTAVIEAPAHNSSLTFEMLTVMEVVPRFANARDNWGNWSYPTFVQLREGADLTYVQVYLDSALNKHLKNQMSSWYEWLKPPQGYVPRKIEYQNLLEIHLAKDIYWERVSDPKYSWILGGIALLILAIACINYISLALTTSAARRVEVGIRKVVGAQKRQVAWQFAIESLMLSVGSMFIGILLVVVFLPYFNEFTSKGIELNYQLMLPITGVAFLIAVAVGLVAGSYPAVYLSGFLPALVLKGRFTSKLQAGFTRPLVVFQFFLSASMIICSVIMYQQMNYITTKDLGFDHEQIVVIPMQVGWNSKSNKMIAQYREAVKGNPAVVSVAGTTSSFNQGWSRYGYKYKEEQKDAFVYGTDTEYIPLLNIQLVEGRAFDPAIISDSTAVIVNEALVRDLRWTDPLNEHLNWQDDATSLGAKVIGVVKDYNFMSLEHQVEPMFLSMKVGYLTTMLVKLSGGDVPNKLSYLQSTWAALFPDIPFEYSFMDQDLNNQYDAHKRWSKIMGLSTVFAIVIACLGLFGLAGINAVNRTKEIGIRKVMGAKLGNIFLLLNRQYVWLAVIAFVLAIPLSWYAMNKWLSTFKFSIEITWQVFAVSLLAGLAIALATVSYHAVKAALINPADTLKHE